MDSLPEECQYLAGEHQQERDVDILKIHLETLWLLATRGGVAGARLVKDAGTYPIIRELHLRMDNEGIRRGCERIVDVIMGDDMPGGSHEKVKGMNIHGATDQGGAGRMVTQAKMKDDEDEDNAIVPIF